MPTGTWFYSALELTTVEELEPLATLLEVPLPENREAFAGKKFKAQMWEALSYYGSHDVAYLLRGGVDYHVILRDVCSKKKVPEGLLQGDSEAVVEQNEVRLLTKLFTEIWEHMSEEEKRQLLRAMNLDERHAKVGGAAAVTLILAGEFGGFATYQLAVMVAGILVRALLGTGLRFAAMTTVTRTLSIILGPVGWIASGAWLINDLASPAYRKTVPAVVQVAALRQLTHQRDVIGVLGAGSTGKDSLLKYVFDVDTENIDPIPGTTQGVEVYQLKTSSSIRLLNFPGFGDLRERVREELLDQLGNCNLAIYLIDASRVVQQEEVERFTLVKNRAASLIVVFNFCDKLDEDEFDKITRANIERLGVDTPVLASLKRKARSANRYFDSGIIDVRTRVNQWAKTERGKPIFLDDDPPAPRLAVVRR